MHYYYKKKKKKKNSAYYILLHSAPYCQNLLKALVVLREVVVKS